MNMDKVGTYQVNACKCKIMKVIWMKVWSRKIPVLIVENSYSEFSTLALETLYLHSSRTVFISTRNKHRHKHARNKQTSTTKKIALNRRKAL